MYVHINTTPPITYHGKQCLYLLVLYFIFHLPVDSTEETNDDTTTSQETLPRHIVMGTRCSLTDFSSLTDHDHSTTAVPLLYYLPAPASVPPPP